METIYLVGQISPKYEETYLWRKRVTEKVRGNFKIIDPCSNPFNKNGLKEKEYAINSKGREFGLDLLVPKDFTYVQRSTIGLVNMNHYDPAKPLLGSFFELAWYFTFPQKAVIAFAEDLNRYECQHPFVKCAVNTWCNTEEEAVALLYKYFISVEGC